MKTKANIAARSPLALAAAAALCLSALAYGPALARDGKPVRQPDVHFVPTPHKTVEMMLRIADVKKSDVVYDLGCGDGRIVIAAAKKAGARAYGFDIDPVMVEKSRRNVRAAGVGHLVTIEQKDIFELDLSSASVVTLYLFSDLNVRLLPQLEKLKPGSRIVSHDFDIAGIEPDLDATVNLDDGETGRIFLWTTPLRRFSERLVPDEDE